VLHAQEHAAQVCADDAVEVVLGDVCGRAGGGRDPGVVESDVEVAEGVDGAAKGGCDLVA
jgi:hypothetical protein